MDAIRASRDIILRTGLFDEAVHFYEFILGFSVTLRSQGLVGFETGSFQLFIERGEPHPPVFELNVSDLPGTRARLLREGCELVEEDPGVPRLYVRDPFGLVFNLNQSSVKTT